MLLAIIKYHELQSIVWIIHGKSELRLPPFQQGA